MAKVLVLYYSSYGHMEQMAYAAAEGVRQDGGCSGSAATPGSTGASRAVAPDMIDKLITSGHARSASV